MMALCKCACGEMAKPGNRFLHGHSSKNAKRPDLAERNRNRIWTEEARRKISVANAGKKHERTEKYKNKLSVALKSYYKTHTHHMAGVPKTADHREKIATALRGKPLSEERKAKISKAHKGLRTYNWTGYVGGYPEVWFADRETTLQRDGRACMIDASHRFSGYRNPDVHHINAIKSDCDLSNLICLCKKCHAKAQGNLPESIPHLQSILSERYGYSYAEGMPA